MIGAALTRLGAEPLLTGRGRFVADVRAEGMLEAVVLRSRHAHARIVRLDTRRARSLSGVRAILTADDVPANAIIPNRVPVPEGTPRYLQPAIARGAVRYVGEPVALIVADSRYIAEDALELIEVEYAPLPVVASVEAARAPGAPRLFPATDSNNVAVMRMRVGDADAALAGAALVLRERFAHPRQTAAALETRGLLAVPPPASGGELHLIGSTKCIHVNRGILAPIFGLPPGALRLVGARDRAAALAAQRPRFERVMGTHRSFDHLQESYFMGTTAEIVDRIGDLERAGIEYLVLAPLDYDLEQLDRIAEEIVPRFPAR